MFSVAPAGRTIRDLALLLRLPWRVPIASGSASLPSMNTAGPLPPILVVDDNPTDVFFLLRRLAAAGVVNPVEHVDDGLEAVRWVERNVLSPAGRPVWPLVVFVDLKMARMNGIEFLTWLHSRGLTGQLTVVVLSTSDDPRDIARANVLGAYRFLTKYPQPADLSAIVTAAAARAGAAGGFATRPS